MSITDGLDLVSSSVRSQADAGEDDAKARRRSSLETGIRSAPAEKPKKLQYGVATRASARCV